MRKSLFVAGLLTFSSLVFAAKSYDLTLTAPAKVAGVEMPKGAYSLHLEGDKAVFRGPHSKEFSVPVKLENGAARKYDYTTVESTREAGEDTIKSIHLGGSTTTLEFGL
jgi:hypothetical protein